MVDFFYGVDTGDDDYELSENVEIYTDRITEGLLPIADDPGGNQICISLLPGDYGKLYFWDHEMEFTPDQAITSLADSFDDFVSGLKENTED